MNCPVECLMSSLILQIRVLSRQNNYRRVSPSGDCTQTTPRRRHYLHRAVQEHRHDPALSTWLGPLLKDSSNQIARPCSPTDYKIQIQHYVFVRSRAVRRKECDDGIPESNSLRRSLSSLEWSDNLFECRRFCPNDANARSCHYRSTALLRIVGLHTNCRSPRAGKKLSIASPVGRRDVTDQSQ